jgi:ferric-chelate reductase (NADPH)
MAGVKKTILSFIGSKILTPAKISSTRNISAAFRMITLGSPAFTGAAWQPGQKLQINTGDWDVRTYTPLSLDPKAGEIKILAFLHGDGPGATWAKNVKGGDLCDVLGPRPSLAVSDFSRPVILFGDETSLAVASTIVPLHKDSKFIFEASSVDEVNAILQEIGIPQSGVVPKSAEDGHLEEAFGLIKRWAINQDYQLVLTGKAQSIQKIRNLIKEEHLPFTSSKVKAYWSEGKEGLD